MSVRYIIPQLKNSDEKDKANGYIFGFKLLRER